MGNDMKGTDGARVRHAEGMARVAGNTLGLPERAAAQETLMSFCKSVSVKWK